jgi:hypothetical protein
MNKSNERARAMKMLKATAVLLLNISGATWRYYHGRERLKIYQLGFGD